MHSSPAWSIEPSPVPSASAAVTTTATVRVVVDVSGLPIPRADIRMLTDGIAFEGFTDSTGTTHFSGLDPKTTYGVVVYEPDFAFAKTYTITPVLGSDVSLTVTGTRTRIRQIGAVRSRAVVRPGADRTQTLDSEAAQIGGSVGSGLGSISSLGTAGSLTIHNEGASTTTATLNGAPIFPTGSAVSPASLGGDIFSSATVGGATIGAPDGTLDLKTYDPTIDWSGLAQARVASYGATSYSAQERGTVGRLGLSATISQATNQSPFADASFPDTSGLLYRHDTTQRSDADAFTLRYGFDSEHSANLDLGHIDSASALVCTFKSGPVPCGYGPGNFAYGSTDYALIRDHFATERFDVTSDLFTSRTSSTIDFANQRVEGQFVGFDSTSSTQRYGAIVAAKFFESARRALTLSLAQTTDVAYSSSPGSATLPLPTLGQSRYSASLNVPFVRTRRFDSNVSFGTNEAYGSSSLTYSAASTYDLDAYDALSASFSGGDLAARLPGFAGVDDPQLLDVECGTGRALGNGPTTGAAPGSTKRFTFNASRRIANYGLSIAAYRHVSIDAPISGILPATLLAPSLFAPTYDNDASSIATGACGKPVSLLPSDVFLRTTAPVSRLVNDGIDVSGNVDLSLRASLGLGYSLALQRGYGASPLFVPGSTLAPGRLIAGATVDKLNFSGQYALSRATRAIANVNVLGANNPYGSHAFGTLDLGLRTRGASSDFVLALQNVTGAHGSGFASFDSFPTLAQPYPARSLSARVRIALGRQDIDHADYLTKPIDTNSAGIVFEELEFGEKPKGGWFAPATSTTFCGPERLPIAKRYLDKIAAFAALYDAARASGTPLPAPVTFEGMSISVVSNASASAVHVLFEHGKKFNAFIRCSLIHIGPYAQSRMLGLYIPTWQTTNRESIWAMYYAPNVGLYFSPNPVNATSDSFEAPTTLPAHAPNAPFALVSTCPASFAPSVRDSLASLKRYSDDFYRGAKPFAPAGFSITAHKARAENWLEIRPDNYGVTDAIAQCVNAPSVGAKAVAKRGLGSAFPPSFNYAPSVGFYTQSYVVQE